MMDLQQNEMCHQGRSSHLRHTELQGQARGGLRTEDGFGNKEVLSDGRRPCEANSVHGMIAPKAQLCFLEGVRDEVQQEKLTVLLRFC